MRIDLASKISSPWARAAMLASLALLPAIAGAQDAPAPVPDKGDTAWMMVSTLLVIMMAVPGLALFYGGMVRSKNMLSVLMQVLVVFSLLTVLWMVYGYSLAFNGPGAWIGDTSRFMLSGITPDSNAATFTDGVVIPEFVFVVFQATFAAITTALAVGAFAERTKFSAVLIFAVIWFTFSYLPIARMVWYTEGFLFKLGALDYAGGTVVHINAGIAGLVGALVVGKRTGLRHDGDAAAQPALRDDRRLAAVGGLVRLQRRLGPGSQQLRRPGVPEHLCRHGGGGLRVDARRMDLPRQAHDAGCLLGCGRWPGRDHPGLRRGGSWAARSCWASWPAWSASGR